MAEADGGTAQLTLLGSFSLAFHGTPVDTSNATQRLFALLAVFGGQAHRVQVAGTLWPDHAESRALSNLRAALWRMSPPCRQVVQSHGTTLTLASELEIDLTTSESHAYRMLDGGDDSALDISRGLLSRDLLPALDEHWLVVPRERHRQLRLHALEALAQAELAGGRPLDAVDTALIAVAAEPLRESAQTLLIRAHLAAGNRAAAIRQFYAFRVLLRTELGVEPSHELCALLAKVGPAS